MLISVYIEDIDSLLLFNCKFILYVNYCNLVGVGDCLVIIIMSWGCFFLCTYCDVFYK